MFGRISLLEGAPRQIFLMGLVFHADAARRTQEIEIAVELMQILMAGQRPEALAALHLRPGERILAAQSREGVMWCTLQEGIVIREIGITVICRGKGGHLAFPD